MIWKIPSCDGGNANAIASAAQAAGLSYVLIKIADGIYSYNVDSTTKKDLVPEVVQALRSRGIQVWGWHYVYGYNPTGEAQIAIRRVQELGLNGYVIDAEGEFKESGKDVAAETFMIELRKGLPNTPVAICSYRFPSYHPQFPWQQFLERSDYNMPQVYWMSAHNPGAQLQRTVREFQAMTPFRPIMPTGPVFRNYGWEPSQAEIIEFLQNVVSLNLSSTNFFAWDYARSILQPLWDTIAAFPFGSSTAPKSLPEQYIAALNTHDLDQIMSLYASNAVHVTAAQTIQGTDAIRAWYNTFINQTIPNATFKLTGQSTTGNSYPFTWQASSSKGNIQNGNDTMGVVNNKISYHYSFYSITG
ncbi:MAG: nuclear transport factor 2 family protein [Anaerolineaceae bacterium]|nr:nuclear transport factor 2 family protein [Anaerolineaceae bacterium]